MNQFKRILLAEDSPKDVELTFAALIQQCCFNGAALT